MPIAGSCSDVGIKEPSSGLVFEDVFIDSKTVRGGTMVSSGEEGMSTGTFQMDVDCEVVVVEVMYWSISNFSFLTEVGIFI